MSTSISPSPTRVVVPLPLDAFRVLATQGNWLYLCQDADGGPLRVCASTVMPDPETSHGDVALAFVAALEQAFSPGIRQAVVDALGLAPGQPLSVQDARHAIAMAETSAQALQGVDFMTQLAHSATAQGAGFAAACRAQRVEAAALDARQRASIDAAMQQRFAEAARQGQSPVDELLAQQWLRSELALALGRTPASH